MQKISTFEDLAAWQESHKLVLSIYSLTDQLPQRETFGLADQMRRASVSVTSNIAEGFGRLSYRDKCRFYFMARGSIIELQNQLLVVRDIYGLDIILILAQLNQAHKILNGLIKYAKQSA